MPVIPALRRLRLEGGGWCSQPGHRGEGEKERAKLAHPAGPTSGIPLGPWQLTGQCDFRLLF